MNALQTLQDQLEGIPGFDYVIDYYNDKVGDKFQTKDPFFIEIDGKSKTRKLPKSFSPDARKTWKKIQRKAWRDDNNFFGCFPLNLGLGLAPLLAIIPVLGPFLMYAIHARLINIANAKFQLPVKLIVQLNANIGWDLLISLIPLFGVFFAWLNGCSTRNAALIHSHIVECELQRLSELQAANATQNEVQRVDLGYSATLPPRETA